MRDEVDDGIHLGAAVPSEHVLKVDYGGIESCRGAEKLLVHILNDDISFPDLTQRTFRSIDEAEIALKDSITRTLPPSKDTRILEIGPP